MRRLQNSPEKIYSFYQKSLLQYASSLSEAATTLMNCVLRIWVANAFITVPVAYPPVNLE